MIKRPMSLCGVSPPDSPFNKRKFIGIAGSRQGGFTLLEVLVAMAVAGIAIVAAFELFSGSLRAVSASDEHVQVAMLAHAKMRDALSRDDLSALQWDEAVSEDTADGVRRQYSVSVSLTPRALQSGRDIGQLRLYDVALTVSWGAGTKQKSYTVHGMRLVNEAKR